jgi:putative membrane protein insertion efficiency factor
MFQAPPAHPQPEGRHGACGTTVNRRQKIFRRGTGLFDNPEESKIANASQRDYTVNPAQGILVLCVRVYQRVLSPALAVIFGPFAGCRFEPTCSQYAVEAVQQHGALRGSWLASRRLCGCHPWGGCGHDPVPSRRISSTTESFEAVSLSAAPVTLVTAAALPAERP